MAPTIHFVKLDNQFPDHPKVLEAGPQAAWLYVAGLCYCSRQLSDGFIPASIVSRLCDVRAPKVLASRLVRVGLWVETEGGYRVHNYLDHQTSAKDVSAAREANKERQRKWRERNNNGVTNAVTNGEVTRPETDIETETELETDIRTTSPATPSRERAATPKKRATPLPQNWTPDPDLRAWGSENYPKLDLYTETQKFKNHALANGRVQKDWRAAWRNWIINAATRYGSPSTQTATVTPINERPAPHRPFQPETIPCEHGPSMCGDCRREALQRAKAAMK